MDQPQTTAERILSTAEVAKWIGVSENTMRFWRWDGRGPKWFKIGAKIVKYRESDVVAWINEQYDAANPNSAA